MIAMLWTWDSSRDAYVQLRLDSRTHTAETPFVLHQWGGPDDEGHSSGVECYWLDEDEAAVHSLQHSRGSDCDGPYEHNTEHVCPVADLAAGCHASQLCDDGIGTTAIPEITLPKWSLASESQRDHFAEAMGY